MKINQWTHSLRKLVYRGYQSEKPFLLLQRHFSKSKASIQIFYGLLLFSSLPMIRLWNKVSEADQLFPPTWFTFLNAWPPWALSALVIVTPFILTFTFLYPQKQSLRMMAFLSFLLCFAYKCSFNRNYHGEMIILYASFAFALIPSWSSNKRSSRKQQHVHLHFYWFGLLLFLLPYTLSGLWKLLWGMGYQLLFAEMSFWNIQSMANVISNYVIRTGNLAPFSDFLIQNYWLGYPILLVGSLWEVLAILPLFRPSHWRLTAVALFLLHLLSIYIFDIEFHYQIAAALFFIWTVPLQKDNITWRHVLLDFPLIGRLYSVLGKTARTS